MKLKTKNFHSVISDYLVHSFRMITSNNKRTFLLICGTTLCVILLSVISLIMTDAFKNLEYSTLEYPTYSCTVSTSNNLTSDDLIPLSESYECLNYNKFLIGNEANIETNITSTYITINEIGVSNNFLDSYLPTNEGGTYVSSLLYGRLFNENEINGYESSIIISESTSLVLFETNNSVGQKLTIGADKDKKEYLVVGIIKDSFSSADNYNNYIKNLKTGYYNSINLELYTPYANINDYKYDNFNYLVFYTSDKSVISCNTISTYFKSMFKYCDINSYLNKEANFQYSYEEYMEKYIPMLIAVIVIETTIMLLFVLFSVKERVKEIGIKKAIGASSKDITIEFLLENSILALIISGIGVIIGLLIYLLYMYITSINTYFIFTYISYKSILYVFLFSLSLIILSSAIPGFIAGRIKIVDAVRFE